MKYVIIVPDMELKMWEATNLPENLKGADGKVVKGVDGKNAKTGKMIEYTTYTFRNLTGEVEKIMSLKSEFRALEGKLVTVSFGINRSEFQGKTDCKMSLIDVVEQKKK